MLINRRVPHEVPGDPAPPDPDLPHLKEIQKLQLLRRIAADAEVAMARHVLSMALQSVKNTMQSLVQREEHVRQTRQQKQGERMAQPAAINVLKRWRHDEFAMLAGMDRHRNELQEKRDTAQQAEERLAASMRRRRLIEARREKYSVLIDELSEAH